MNLFDLYAKISLDSSDYERGIDDAQGKTDGFANKVKSGFSAVGNFAKKGLGVMTAGSTAAGAALLGLESATEEYRVAMGKLNTAFETAGYNLETAKGVYTDFYAILGDTDTATEASQLLAKLSNSQEDLATWTRISAGVYGTFGDSLPIESMIESANETAKVGTVTGTLADALNWAGISEDEFNAKLAAAGSEAERNQIIMQTLSETYDEASESFYRNNEELVKARENQAKLDESMARIGSSVTTVKNALLEEFTPEIENASIKVTEFIEGFDFEEAKRKLDSLLSTFEALLPAITGVTAATYAYKAAMAISALITTVTTAIKSMQTSTQGMTVAQAALNLVMKANPFVLIVTLIVGVVTALITLIATNEDFRNKVIEVWNKVKETVSGVVDTIKTFFTQKIPDAFNKLVETVKQLPKKFKEVGKHIVEGIWDGIKGAKNWIIDKIKGFGQDVLDGMKDFFGIHSPSTVARDEVGKNIGKGVAVGIEESESDVKKSTESLGYTVINGFDEIINDLQGKYDNLKSKLSGFGSLFTTGTTEEGTPTFELSDLEDQISQIESYGDMITKLREKMVPESLMNEILNMGVEDATSYMDALLDMGDSKLDDYIELYQQKQEAIAEVADSMYGDQLEKYKIAQEATQKLQGGASETVSGGEDGEETKTPVQSVVDGITTEEPALYEKFEEVKEKLKNVTDSFVPQFEAAGEMLMEGIAVGVESRESDLIERIVAVLQATVRAAKSAMGIASPSKVFKQIGGFMAEGLGVGWSEKMKSVRTNIAASMKTVPQAATSSANSYTFGDIILHVANLNNRNNRDVKTFATELEFERRQQASAKGVISF